MKLLSNICSMTILAAVVIVGVGTTAPAHAQSIIEEIVVTATKREENIGTVPVAVTAISGNTIESAGMTSLENIQALVPSLSYGKGGTNRNSNLSLRGVGTISFAVGAEPGVSTVVDGVVLARQGQAFAELYDIERVEVLRGPQGTLFGKNASSGLINIISKGPTEEFEGDAQISYYEDNELRLKGSVSGPLSDTVQYRLNAAYGNFDGFVKNAFNGQDIYGYDRWGVRGMLDFAPNDAVSVRVIGEHYETDDLCCSEVVIVDDGSIQATAFQLGGGVIEGAATRTTASNAVQRTENEGNALTVQLDWDFDNFLLTSITGYRDWSNTERQDIDDTPFGASERDGDVFADGAQTLASVDGLLVGLSTARDYGPQEWQQWSQELRLTSTTDGPLEWQVGLFVWHAEVDRQFGRFDALCVNDPGGVIGGVDISGLAATDNCPSTNIVLPSANSFQVVENDSLAIFGQATYDFTDATSVTVGLRYTDDENFYSHERFRVGDDYKDLLGNNNGDNNDDGGVFALASDKPLSSGTVDEQNVSGKISLQHDFSDGLYGFVSYASGYKGPAWNVFFNMDPVRDTVPRKEETSDAIEAGFKWQLDSALITATLFRQVYDNFQANNFILTAGAVTTNLTDAGEVTTEGLEFEFIAQPTDELSFFGGVTLANAEITDPNCRDVIGTVQEGPCLANVDTDLPFAPKVKGSVAAEYRIPVSSWDGAVTVNSNVSFQSESYAAQFEPAAQQIDGYSLVNASVAFSFNEDKYRVAIHGNNLFDENYVAAFNEGGRVARLPRDGSRYFGVSFRASF